MLLFRNRFVINVPEEQVPYVVPFEADGKKVGKDYIYNLAKIKGAEFKRNPKDMGLMDSMDTLEGTRFNPKKIDPLIREFYEKTTNFTLTVTPKWNRGFLPAFWLFRKLLAEKVEQANLPFDIKEAQKGMESYIETVDFDQDKIVDLRSWVRTYRNSELPIYVGIYTTFRDGNEGYVSVGFPFPEANLTATLYPSNINERDFLLESNFKIAKHCGDFISLISNTTGNITALRLNNFYERIFVFVRDGKLFTNHYFFFFEMNFLTLFYAMERKE